MSNKNSWLPHEISGFGDFVLIFSVLFISILISNIILGGIFGVLIGGGRGKVVVAISLIAHFIWLVSFRDYGFWMIFLLFGLLPIAIIFLDSLIRNFIMIILRVFGRK
jgi:hypothetical protein